MSGFPHFGRYQIERSLGQGSYGSVYLALDPQLQQQVVLKVLRDDLAADANTRQWFTREAKNLALLSGSGQFEQVYNFFESHQPPYLVMEVVSGQTLEAELGRGGRSVEEALPILQQIAAALDTAHKNGLLHGDLRPSSVLLQQNQRLKVIDFGLVKRTPSAEAMRDVPNAPSHFLFYMAPEQADVNRRSEIAAATDIYALGVIAYQMLTGRLPYEGHHEAILEGHRYQTPTDARFFNPSLLPPVEQVLKKVLSKEPRERYATAEAFVKALEAAHRSEAETRSRAAVSPPPQSPASSQRSYDLRQPSSGAAVRPGSELPKTTPLDSSIGSNGGDQGPTSAASRRNGFPIWAIVALLLLLAVVAGGFYWWISGEQELAPNGTATATATATLSPIESSTTATPALEGVTSSPTVIASATTEQPESTATATPTVITSPTEATEAASPTVGEAPTEAATPTVGEAPTEAATPTVGEAPTEAATPTVGEAPTELPSPTVPQEPTLPPSPTVLQLPTVLPTIPPLDLATVIPLPTIPGIEEIPTLFPVGTIEIPSFP